MSKSKKIIIISAIVLGVLLVLTFVSSLLLGYQIMAGGKRRTLSDSYEWQSSRYDTSFYNDLEKNEYTIEMDDGYIVHAEFLKNPSASNKYIILSHGYSDNRMGSLKYARMYLSLGFNCIIYDLRGHGENAKDLTTYGIKEGKDLATIIADTRTRYTSISQLGIHGESLGAATTISSLKYKPNVDFAVSDCGFSDIENVLKGGLNASNIPSFVFDIANIGTGILYGYNLYDMRPIDSLTDNSVPILFVHGENDASIIPKNAYDMYDKNTSFDEIYIMHDAAHAESVLVDLETYKNVVQSFLTNLAEQ